MNHNFIALLGAEVNESYQSELWRGISDEAERREKQLICFLGSRNSVPSLDTKISRPFYRLAHSGNFDGVIVVSSTLSTYLNPIQVRSIFDTRPDIPKISIGMVQKGSGSVCVNGRKGMAEIVGHMLDTHRRSKFAIIAGPKQHPESEERRETIEAVLGERGISVSKELIVHGKFDKGSGRVSVEKLLARGREFDSLFCLNDRMAIGAIEELTARGISVPDEISVCGFDGIEEASYCSPPLTTVKQPLYDLGVRAVEELYSLMEGGEPREITLDCHMITGESCACQNRLEKPAGKQAPGKLPGDSFRFDPERSLNSKDLNLFRENIHRITSSSIYSGNEWNRTEAYLNRLLSDIPSPRDEWLPALIDARDRLWERRTREMINTRLEKEQRSHLLRNVAMGLAGSFELSSLFRHLGRGLEQLQFPYGFLALYPFREEEGNSRLALSLRQGKSEYPQSVTIPSDEILPGIENQLAFPDCRLWMFIPLVFQDRTLGHMLLSGTHGDTEIYETLAGLVSSSLQGAILMEQVRNHEVSLMGEVKKRTRELVRANGNLKKEIGTRIRLEQEVADISKHTMERIGQDLHDDLCQHLAGTALQVSALEQRLKAADSQVRPQLEGIRCQLNESIGRAKRIVKGMVPLGIAEEGIFPALENLCRDMSGTYGMKIECCYEEPRMDIEAERAVGLYRIVQEALNNSIKHSKGDAVRVICQGAGKRSGVSFSVSIEDNGIGFDEKAERNGMGLKIMQYRGRRAGINVNIRSTGQGTVVLCEG